MKKGILILAVLLILSGCNAGDSDAFLDVPTVIDQPETADKPGCLIEIPQIMGSRQPAASVINEEILELSKTLQDIYLEDEIKWCEMTAWPTEAGQYLNLTVLVQEYPSYGTSGQVLSWVYDRDTGSQILMDDALSMAKTDMETITADIADWCSENDYLVTEDVLAGLAFRMIDEKTPQFMASAMIIPEALAEEIDPWAYFFTWTDGNVEYSDISPFSPAEVTGAYSNFLWCQSFEEMMGQFGGDSAVVSEEEAMMLFEEIYEINKYLEDGYEMRFDGNTVEIGYETCICAVLGKEVNGEFVEEGYYAAAWGSAYWYDPEGDAWIAVGFG